jgi:hypothetical protein
VDDLVARFGPDADTSEQTLIDELAKALWYPDADEEALKHEARALLAPETRL